MSVPVLAHAAHGLGQLGLSTLVVEYLVLAALGVTVLALRRAWPTARLGPVAGDDAPARPGGPLGLVGAAGIGLLLVVAVAGPADAGVNLAGPALDVAWLLVLALSLLVGDVWGQLSPFPLLARLRPRTDEGRAAPAWVPAALLVAFFVRRSAVAVPDRPSLVAGWLVLAVVVVGGGAVVWGPAWARTADPFALLDRAAGRLAVLRRQPHPLRAVAAARPSGAEAAVLAVAAGAIVVDALTGAEAWQRFARDRSDLLTGLAGAVGTVLVAATLAGAWVGAARLVARTGSDGRPLARTTAAALPPLVVGAVLAHELGLALVEAQNVYVLASDPFGRGADLFGTIDHVIDPTLLPGGWSGALQLLLLVGGGLVALVVAHDRALATLGERAARSDGPLLGALALAVVGATWVLLGG